MQTLKITSDSPKLIRKLKAAMLAEACKYADRMTDHKDRYDASKAINTIRIERGEK